MAHTILKPTFERTDERGIFREILNEGRWESILGGQMRAGAVLGNHYHKITTVFFFLLSGAARIRTIHVETGARDAFDLHANEGVLLVPDESHAITFLEESNFLLLKSHHYDANAPDTYKLVVPE